MSRWDSLKPVDRGASKALGRSGLVPKSARNHRTNPRRVLSQEQKSGARSQSRSEQRSRLSRTTVTAKESNDMFLRHLNSFKANSDRFDASLVIKDLEKLKEISPTDFRSCLLQRVHIVLIEFLNIDDSRVQHLVSSFIAKALKLEATYDVMTGDEVNHFLQILSEKSLNEKNSNSIFIECICEILLHQVVKLPSERTAENVVGRVLLPRLSSQNTNNITIQAICDALGVFLDVPGHASAVLGPLVEDVGIDGREKRLVNPLRKLLLSSLACIILRSESDCCTKSVACGVLTKAIKALRRIDGKADSISAGFDFDFIKIENFILDVFENFDMSLMMPSMHLLQAIADKYPKTGIKLGSRLVLEPFEKSIYRIPLDASCGCGGFGASFFPSIIHAVTIDGTVVCQETKILALDCLTKLVSIMPWTVWLSKQSSSSHGVTGFRRRVLGGLKMIIRLTRCALLTTYHQNDSLRAIARLSDTIFQQFPFENAQVAETATGLLLSVAGLFDQSKDNVSGLEILCSMLTTSMGGRVTPQGNLLPMTVPAHSWLSKQSSGSFLKGLFKFTEIKQLNSRECSLQLLVSILRTRPKTAYEHWQIFYGLVQNLFTDTESRKGSECARLLEAFFSGRRDFSDSSTLFHQPNAVMPLIRPVLVELSCDARVKCRLMAFRSFSALLREDWIALNNVPLTLNSEIECILSRCEHDNAKVRNAACKAIGEFCTHYFGSLDSAVGHSSLAHQSIMLSSLVCTSNIKVLNGADAQVKAMALYSLGNFGRAIREAGAQYWPIEKLTLPVCKTLKNLIEDDNDKVAGNAIRSIGHWAHFLLNQSTVCTLEEWSENKDVFFQVLSSLVEKLSNARVDVSGTSTKLSWRQRSVAKKHGWGACHSIGQIFRTTQLRVEQDFQLHYRDIVQHLTILMDPAVTNSNKVALSAMAALRELKPLHLAEVADKSGIVGDALAFCISRIFKTEDDCEDCEACDEYELVLHHLLASASIYDAYIALKRGEIAASGLENLYEWMVVNNLGSRAFEIFALALQRPGLGVYDVSMEQNFASRASLRMKSGGSTATSSNIRKAEDDTDEL